MDTRHRRSAAAAAGTEAARTALAAAAALACVALLTAATASRAESAPPADGLIASPEPHWPRWRGRRRDGVCDEKNLLQTWPADGPKLLWELAGLGRGYSSPIIAAGSLYITGDIGNDAAEVFAFDLQGKPKWQAPNGRAWKRSYPGARASCAYSDGRIYHMNAHGRVACLDAKTGGEVWAVNVLKRFEGRPITWGLSECLLVDGDRLIVTPGGRKALLAALDKATGKTVWAGEPLDEKENASYASPILFAFGGRRLLATCSSRHAVCVDADTGKLLWTRPRPTRYQAIVSSPVYHAGAVFFTSPDGKEAELFRLTVAGRDVRAERVWTNPLNVLSGGVVLVGGRLYGSGYRQNDGWFCVDFETGKTLHEKRDLHSGSAVWADGRLYCLSERGEMALLKPTDDALEQAGRFRLVQGKKTDVWAHPVIHAGRLYLRYHDKLTCYDIRAN